jgi:deazaflavin-dependent oxidoreductase (nitroreductase family)
MRFATVIDRPLLRVSNGRLRLSFVIPCLLLRCLGARTGRVREVPLLYVQDGEDFLLVGSGGGTEKEPAWCANLRAQPAVETICGGVIESRAAELLTGTARERAWRLALEIYPGYQRYQARISREIPLFRLRKVPAPQKGMNYSSKQTRTAALAITSLSIPASSGTSRPP